MNKINKLIAQKLLDVKAIKLQPQNPFTWASGWTSPIYCDNRKTLSYPDVRNLIKLQLSRLVMEMYPDADAIAGVATGAIAQGALVADTLGLPFVYVRSSPKGHGMENLIEGDLKPGMKVVVIEDLISTGGSSLKAVNAIRNNACEVAGMLAIFTYGFEISTKDFAANNVELTTLSDYQSLLSLAVDIDYIKSSDVETLEEWRRDPSNWKPKK